MTIDLKKLFPQGDDIESKMSNALLKAIKENYTTQFDYLTFKQSVAKMRELGLDEETSYKSAFATASTMGYKKSTILTSISQYKTVLNKEKERFADSLKHQIAVKVDGKNLQVEKIKKQIASHKSKIESLQKEILIYEDKLNNMDSIVEENRTKIMETRDNFKAAYDNLYTQIEEDLLSVDKYL